MAIPEGKYYNKIVFGGNTLIDVSADTVDGAHLLSGYTAHDRSGAPITGSCAYDADTSDATAVVAELLKDKTAYVNGVKLTGAMPNNGAVEGAISAVNQEYTVPQGYHDGSGKVSIAATEQAKLVPGNIMEGVEILGVTGTLSPGGNITAQSKSVTPSTVAQTVLPDEGYDYLSQVAVAAIPFTETENAAGGFTATIG